MGQSASKEKFGESVQALLEVDVSPDNAAFWDELWKIPASAQEVFELIPARAARRLRDDRFENLATLYTQAVAQLCQIVETPYNIYFDQALNCVRVLTRILPFLLEKGDLGDADENVEQLCWGTGATSLIGNGNANNDDDVDDEKIGLMIGGGGSTTEQQRRRREDANDDDEDVEDDGLQRKMSKLSISKQQQQQQQDDENNPNGNPNGGADDQEPLALLVVHAAMHMLFLPQFTCDFYEDNTNDNNANNMGSSNNNNNNNAADAAGGGNKKNYNSNNDDETAMSSHQNSNMNDNSNIHMSSHMKAKKKYYERSKEDMHARHEAGLCERSVEWGVTLDPSPSSIIWAPGAGITPAGGGGGAGNDNSGSGGGTSSVAGGSISGHGSSHHTSSGGVGGSGGIAPTRKYDKNRIEVLRLLLAASCDPLYSPADEYNPLASRWLAVATAADAPNVICLFYSLLNTILSYDPRAIPVAVGGFSEGHHIKLVELSIQVLCVLLDCGIPGSPDPVVDQNGIPCVEFEVASKGGFNMLRTLVARMDNGKELSFVYNGFTRLLRNVYEAESTYMGGSKLECFQELLVLFWKFLEENPYFMNHILTRCNINDVIVPICFLMYKSRRDPTQIGLVHICTFVLLKMSGERSFGVSLNKSYHKKLPTDLPLFHGCHADLLAITLHKLVVNGAYKLVPLYSCFLTIIANVSPYWKSTSLVAAVKLVNLFELFSSPKFLYSGEYAHRHLALLLEVFNNIIQYQYHGNAHLVYAIVRRKDSFGQLAALTLEQAQSACHKVYGEQMTFARDRDNNNNTLQNQQQQQQRGGNDTDSRAGSLAAAASRNGKNNNNIRSSSSYNISGPQNSGIGSHGSTTSATTTGQPFNPNREWLDDLKTSLPMETVTRLLQHLVPVVDDIVAKKQGTVDEQEILDVLNEITMVGLLPVPHPIVIRKYQPNQYTALWFTAFMWGVIFLRNQTLPLFDGECIELFQVSLQDDDD